MTYNFHVPWEKWCVIFPKNPLNFIKNYPSNQWFCVERCSVKIMLLVVSNGCGHQCKCWWRSSKSEGCMSIKRRGHQCKCRVSHQHGIGGTSPNSLHFSLHSRRDDGTQITQLIHLSVHSCSFSLDVVTTLVHTFPRRTRQPSQRLGAWV